MFLLFLLFAVGCSALHLPNALWNTFNEAKFRSLAGVGLLLLNLAFASVRPGEAAVPRDVEQMLVASKWGKIGDNNEAFYLAQRPWEEEAFNHEF